MVGTLAFVVALCLWLAPQIIALLFGVEAPQLLPPLDGTPLELLDPFISDGPDPEG